MLQDCSSPACYLLCSWQIIFTKLEHFSSSKMFIPEERGLYLQEITQKSSCKSLFLSSCMCCLVCHLGHGGGTPNSRIMQPWVGHGWPLIGEENLMVHIPTWVIYLYAKTEWRCRGCALSTPSRNTIERNRNEKEISKQMWFSETEEQFILSTASKNLENIWKSQKTS